MQSPETGKLARADQVIIDAEVNASATAIGGWQAALHQRERTIGERERRLDRREQQVDERTTHSAEHERDLGDREQRVHDRGQDVAEQERQLAQREIDAELASPRDISPIVT